MRPVLKRAQLVGMQLFSPSKSRYVRVSVVEQEPLMEAIQQQGGGDDGAQADHACEEDAGGAS